MLKNNISWLFYLLLIPTYLLVAIVLLIGVIGENHVLWGYFLLWISLNLLAAWLISHKGKLILPIVGLALNTYYSWEFLASYYYPASSFNHLALYERNFGFAILGLGVMGFVIRVCYISIQRNK